MFFGMHIATFIIIIIIVILNWDSLHTRLTRHYEAWKYMKEKKKKIKRKQEKLFRKNLTIKCIYQL